MVRSVIASIAIVVTSFAHVASGSEILLLDFTSPTCGPCQQMASTIESLQRAGYPIRQIDVTRDTPSAVQFKVARVPMLVMLVDNQEFERIEGGMSGRQLEGMFQRAKSEVERRNQDRIRSQSPDRGAPFQSAPLAGPAQPPSTPWPSEPQGLSPRSGATEFSNVQFVPDRSRLADSQYDRSPPASDLSTMGRAPYDSVSSVDPRLATLIGASVRLRVEDASGHAYGTGTMIDAREGEALVVTCGHLFRESKGKGPLTVELFEATASGPRSLGQVPGLVISYDLERDVALVAIRPGRPVPVVPVAPPRTKIERGDRVASVGCSNGQDPTLLASRVTSIDRYQGPPNIETTGAPVEGRSGGGLFNEQGQLIGVCFAADNEANEGLYAALKAIQDELSAHGLSDVFTRSAVGSLAANAPASGPIIRGQEPGAAVMPPPSRERTMPDELFPAPVPMPVALNASNAGPAPIALANPVEEAAWDEIMNRAATSEVICIIRPKQPGGQSEVITLDGMSPEFVRALASLRKDSASFTR